MKEKYLAMKRAGQKIVMLTAYDYWSSRLLGGADVILVGDSLGMVMLGHKSTHSVTMQDMVRAVEAVSRGTKKPIMGDMPIGSYENAEDALMNARRLLDAGAAGVKIEGNPQGIAKCLVAQGIEVMGHVGLTPQSAKTFGVQGKQGNEAEGIVKDAMELEADGCFSIVIECVPAALAERITAKLRIPTIGIGAGRNCDGQVLVTHDMLGLFEDFRPRFVKRYAEGGAMIRDAVARFAEDVKAGRFPAREHSY
ncbi:MAG: 3-methyl-2-oxobutanoate hydroxymethyltransferase [archaeon]